MIRDAHLRGDLDNIVLKAIRNRPEERYSTVEQLSADVWRFIDGQPILARPATITYRARKFVGRNRLAITAATLVFIALVTGIILAAWQANEANGQARIAGLETEKAVAEKAKAEKVSRFLMKIISYANPKWHAEGHRFGGEARVIDALNDLASKIDTEFADEPDVLAELHHQFCDAYLSRKESETARTHALRALELRRLYYGDWHELVAKDMVFVYWTRPQGTTDADVQLLSDAIVMMRATNPKNLNLPFMLETYFHRMSDDVDADYHEMFLRHVPLPAPQNKYLAADQLFDEMLGLLRLHFAEDSPQVVLQKCVGTVLKFRVNKMDESEGFYQPCKQAAATQPSLRPYLEAFRNVSGRTD